MHLVRPLGNIVELHFALIVGCPLGERTAMPCQRDLSGSVTASIFKGNPHSHPLDNVVRVALRHGGSHQQKEYNKYATLHGTPQRPLSGTRSLPVTGRTKARVTTWGVRRARKRIGSDGSRFPKRFSKLQWISEHHSNTLVHQREGLACLLISPEMGQAGSRRGE